MKRLFCMALVLLAFLLPGLIAVAPAAAQTACPSGVSPGDARCGPGGGNGLWVAPPVRQPAWRYKNRFGAYALGVSSEGRVLGTATGRKTRAGAENAAIDHCRAQGGSECRMIFWFKNTCSGLAYPVDAGPFTYFEAVGSSEKDAVDKAIDACTGATGVPCITLTGQCAGTEWHFS